MGILFIVSAPSGAGKTSLVNEVIRRLSPVYDIRRAVTYTSKTPRSDEVDGDDYHFITSQEFEARIKEGFFIEHSTVYGTYYGSSRSLLNDIKEGKSYILIIDRVGAKQVFQQEPSAILIWIDAPSLYILEDRLKKRAKDSHGVIKNRLLQAKIEINEEVSQNFYHYHILNDVFLTALLELEAIIITKLSNGV